MFKHKHTGYERHPPSDRRLERTVSADPEHQLPRESWCSVCLGNAPAPRLGPPFATRRLLVCLYNGRINHDVAVVRVVQQHLEDPLPKPIPGSEGEAFVDAFPVAVLGGQVFPMSAAAQHPQNTVHENPAVPGGYPHRPGTPWQKAFYAMPLRSAQFVPLQPRLPSTSLLLQSYTLPPRAAYLPCSHPVVPPRFPQIVDSP